MYREPSHLNRADRIASDTFLQPPTLTLDDGEGKPEDCSGNLDPVSKTASASEASVRSVPDRKTRRLRSRVALSNRSIGGVLVSP